MAYAFTSLFSILAGSMFFLAISIDIWLLNCITEYIDETSLAKSVRAD